MGLKDLWFQTLIRLTGRFDNLQKPKIFGSSYLPQDHPQLLMRRRINITSHGFENSRTKLASTIITLALDMRFGFPIWYQCKTD
jgi:hypothetical protein